MENIPINYIEFKTNNLSQTKDFYSKVFGWNFIDYGPTYSAFEDAGIEGGFEYSEEKIQNGVLVVLHHKDLESIQEKIIEAGGKITVETFTFPGGSRFQFKDLSGNELAVWCKI